MSAQSSGDGAVRFDRHLVLEQLGGWRGMVDASLPTVAFIVANAAAGLRAGIWSAVGAAAVLFVLRLARRQSVQQAISGLLAVGVAVALAGSSGSARDFFVVGIVRNAALGVVLLASVAVRWPLVGVIAEFLAPSHLGGLATQPLPSWRSGLDRARAGSRSAPEPVVDAGPPADPRAEPAPERHWREDRRTLRAYGWLTVLWSATFLLRLLVQGLLYQRNSVGWLGTSSIVLGLPLTAVVLVVTLWAVARLHRHRGEPGGHRPAAPGSPPRTEPDASM